MPADTQTTSISFSVPGEPVAFARARVNAGGKRFTPRKQAGWSVDCGILARTAMRGRAPFAGPVHLDVMAVYVPPDTWPKARRAAALWKTSTPDADNLVKLCADALKGIVWRDDAQAAKVTVEKIYGATAETIVTVTPLVDREAA